MQLRRRQGQQSARLEEMRKVPFPSTGQPRLDKAITWLLQRSQKLKHKGYRTYYFEGDVPDKLVRVIIRTLDPAKTARARDGGGKEVVYYWGGMKQGGSISLHRGAYPDTRNSIRFAANDFRSSSEWQRTYGGRS